MRGFLAASAGMGTLDEIPREGEHWRAPEFVAVDRLTMSLA